MEQVKKSWNKEQILAYVYLLFLGLVSFNLGGTRYSYLFQALGFVLAAVTLTLISFKLEPSESKALLYYSIPLIIFAIFTSFSRYHLSGLNGLSSSVINAVGILSFFALGYISRHIKTLNLRFLLMAVLVGFALFTLIGLIANLAEYGPFYSARFAGLVYYEDGIHYTLSSEAMALEALSLVTVSKAYGFQLAYLLAASLAGLLFLPFKANKSFFLTVAITGGIGLLDLLLCPYWTAIILLVPVYLLALLLRFVKFPQATPKWEKTVAWTVLSLGSLFAFIVVVNGIAAIPALCQGALGRLFTNNRIMLVVNEIVHASFWKATGTGYAFDLLGLFGMKANASSILTQSFAGLEFDEGFYLSNSLVEFSVFYEGGLLAFIAFIALFAFASIALRKYLHTEQNIDGAKLIVVALLLGWFLYHSLLDDAYPFAHSSANTMYLVSSFTRNDTFLVMMFLLGVSYTPVFNLQKHAALGGDDDE